jgi:hypothetical protein
MGNAKDKDALISAADLRRRAEKLLKTREPDSIFCQGDAESLRLLHELQVHQIELEMQNAELLQARGEVESMLEKYTDLYDFAPVAYFTLDHVGAILAANLTAASFLGIERSRLLGRRFSLFVVNEHRQLFSEFLGKVLANQGMKSCEVMLTTGRKLPFYVQVEANGECFCNGQLSFHFRGHSIPKSECTSGSIRHKNSSIKTKGRWNHDGRAWVQLLTFCWFNLFS